MGWVRNENKANSVQLELSLATCFICFQVNHYFHGLVLWMGHRNENKANSVQLQLQLLTGTELANKLEQLLIITTYLL